MMKKSDWNRRVTKKQYDFYTNLNILIVALIFIPYFIFRYQWGRMAGLGWFVFIILIGFIFKNEFGSYLKTKTGKSFEEWSKTWREDRKAKIKKYRKSKSGTDKFRGYYHEYMEFRLSSYGLIGFFINAAMLIGAALWVVMVANNNDFHSPFWFLVLIPLIMGIEIAYIVICVKFGRELNVGRDRYPSRQ
jgi:uncharacterized membrane protein YraQ (UPF0718 family)